MRNRAVAVKMEVLSEGSPLEILDGIRISGQEAPVFEEAYEFLSALGEEIRMMKRRLLSGDRVALGFVEVLTRAMR